jgi:hypothetical protein
MTHIHFQDDNCIWKNLQSGEIWIIRLNNWMHNSYHQNAVMKGLTERNKAKKRLYQLVEILNKFYKLLRRKTK